MMDLDHFKNVNDTYGHLAGDMVLRELSETLQECFRGADIPCRYGGEEFAIILSNADMEGALAACERFRNLVAGHQFDYNGMEFQITVSIGIASFTAALKQSATELIAASDQALYQAKKEGRNRIREAYGLTRAKKTVLLVDDEEIIIDIGKKLLNHIGYNVLTAGSGEEAVAVYEKNRDSIEIVLLDMVMPDVGGGGTYDRLRKINPEVKVLLTSGYHVESEVEELLERGCAGFIKKPFEIAQLSQKVGELLAKG
jgi:diguanylate cyclase (GGDEF)-like protein